VCFSVVESGCLALSCHQTVKLSWSLLDLRTIQLRYPLLDLPYPISSRPVWPIPSHNKITCPGENESKSLFCGTDMSLAQLGVDGIRDNKHAQELLKKIKIAAQRVSTEENTTLTEDELVQLIRVWEPQRDIICLYVRWARQLRRNFNLDSIATLLCLSRQCGYTPVDFLRKVKTLSVHKSDKTSFGVSFHFDIPNRKDLNREKLSKEFIGLSVTLCLLQEQVHSSSILGKTGMRHSSSTPRLANPIHIPLDSKQTTDMVSHPTIEFHTQSSLMNRIWLSISHRWLALFLVEHLFREVNAPWSYQDAIVYSFQMMACCGPVRYEFLSPLVGYCLSFRMQESISSKRIRLKKIWDDPSTFLPYGNTCLSQFSDDARARIISNCFSDLRNEIPTTCKLISYNRDCSWNRRWLMLRAYIFHFWLDSTANRNTKLIVTNHKSPRSPGKKKRKIPDTPDEPEAIFQDDLSPPLLSVASVPKNPEKTSKSSANGLRSLISSRKKKIHSHKIATPDMQTRRDPLNPSSDQPALPLLPVDKHVDWTTFRLATHEEMLHYVQSYLLIHRSDGVDLLSELSPLEVYSADRLHDMVHCRLTGPAPFYPSKKTGPVVLQIRQDADCYIDISSKVFHIAREQCEYFEEHANMLPTFKQIQSLCKAIACFGSVDCKRATGQCRVNIGNGGQNWVNGAPCQLHGLEFKKNLDADPTFDSDDVLKCIGQLTGFTWKIMCSLQNDSLDHPIAPDTFRKQLYAAHLNEYLSMDPDVGFEDLTLVVSSLHPVITDVTEHKDIMNDTVAGYTRTACFNMVLINDTSEDATLLHFQVICNFRRVIGKFVVPFHHFLGPVAKHAKQYLDKWHRSMHLVYSGKTETIPCPFDRTPFFLDDTLKYSVVAISEKGRHKQAISSEYLLTEINPSRTLSLSMFIDPLIKLQGCIKFDQTMELAFACSFLSNPFWFDWTMSELIRRHDDPNDNFTIGLHPFYDWSHSTIEIFGTWQGGPHNRWSPCGGTKESILQTFGAEISATKEEREQGQQKLSEVINVLWEHVQWINSMSGCGHVPTVDMPLNAMKARCDKTIQHIAQIASCQFSHFRLGIFVTILSGCGLLKAGKHLRHCMYPIKGSASYKHLSSPVGDTMSKDRARALANNEVNESITNDGEGVVHEDNHDLFMQYLSGELGFKVYLRDEIECILCESHPMRSLSCRDWFRKGMSLYDCNENGEFFKRLYGRDTTWMKLSPPEQYDFAFLTPPPIQYIPLDSTIAYYASCFGKELRENKENKVRFKGRHSRTSNQESTFVNNYVNNETFCHPSMRVANFFVGYHVRQSTFKSMFVLEDSQGAMELGDCNDLDLFHFGTLLHRYIQGLFIKTNQWSPVLAAGCYHMDLGQNSASIAFFPGHLDKHFVHTACFVPLASTLFFTLLSVAASENYKQDIDSLRIFNSWKSTLSTHDSKKVDDFLREFESQSKKLIRRDSQKILIYVNRCGSFLSFPANQFYHATITPAKKGGCPRDLFIFHPLDGMSS
jgi:hypothetical protein